ncbi:uncharacterized protein MKZ38_002584 [Zalerion maritima]|uniref:PLAC8-domain-containing protein n=1 Tax=Zalerion maritima TaxID=339359 RepID=A0AAD5RFD3_9PEZI|nr:uncharacterized protein MKZ38_002584 [Zalerion maritima]
MAQYQEYQQHPGQGQGQAPALYHQQQQQGHGQVVYHQGTNVSQQDWQHSFFDCCPFSTCCMSCCLPSRLFGRTAARLRDPTLQSYARCNSDCMSFCAINCIGCGWILVMNKRSEIRQRFGIQGSGGGDCAAACCCPCCAMIQNEEELKIRNATGPITQEYQSQQGMTQHHGR